MKTFALAVMIVCALAGCGGDDGEGFNPIDAPGPPSPDAMSGPDFACNPLGAPGQQGCPATQKCTWIKIVDTPDPIGKLGCVPDGSVPLGSMCTQGATGEQTGYDDCASGGICIGRGAEAVCQDVCGFDGSVASMCEEGSRCVRYSNLGANGTDAPVIGACNPTCDPLHQTRIVDGQTQSCGANKGCYLVISDADTAAVCVGAGTVAAHQDIVGETFANSCIPGLIPRQKVQGQPGNTCTGLCKPADVYMGHQEAYEGGDTRETNWMSPPRPATCESVDGAAYRPGVANTGETCEFFWTREATSNLTAFSNTVGWCFNNASWKYDPDGMDPISNTAPYPRCIDTTTGDILPPVSSPPRSDALYFGCVARPASLTSRLARALVTHSLDRQPVLDRLGPYDQ